MEQTTNFDLKIYEGTDKFNPLTVENANMSAIDAQMKKNQDSGIPTANQLLANSIHSITRDVPSASMFRFTATSRYTTGDSFTVDGVPVTAQMPNGTAVPDGAFIIGSTVLCSLVGQLLTIYSYGIAVADDSEKLGGQLPAYYATKAEVDQAQQLAEAGASVAQNAEDIANNAMASIPTVTRQTLANGCILSRYGKIRHLDIIAAPVPTVLGLTIPSGDRPNVAVRNTGVYYNYIAEVYVNTNGKITGDINSTSFGGSWTALTTSNSANLSAQLTWIVA